MALPPGLCDRVTPAAVRQQGREEDAVPSKAHHDVVVTEGELAGIISSRRGSGDDNRAGSKREPHRSDLITRTTTANCRRMGHGGADEGSPRFGQ